MMFKVIIVILLAYATAEEATVEEAQKETKEEQFKYVKPEIGDLAHNLAESFHNLEDFKQSWVLSEAKKDGVDETISKYDGKWLVDEPKENALGGDLALVLKSEAKHAAISAKLSSTFNFNDQPLIIQYEVKFQKAQECGGAYIKLLADKEGLSLEEFGDTTLYSIMFGPDKCGHDSKMHFILQHENPISGKMVEHHAKPPSGDFKTMFDDKKTHLVTLVVRPGNTFDILLDKKIINSGSLLKDMTPPINPEKEIDDPSDSKPEEWDEREKIPDPAATKPDDWDEDAPKTIVDEAAVKPETWIDDAPEHVSDPDAARPADWDTEEDGEWEAPLIPNPKCTGGMCGEWKQPSIDNPNYKGKWVPALIANPDYKGIWAPKKIANPDFFEDTNPFANLKSISAVGFELWSMQSDIAFDNIILASEQSTVDTWTTQTWDVKNLAEAAPSAASSAKSMFDSVIQATEDKPWLWAIYIIVILLPFVLIYTFCFPSKDKSGERKKTDEASPDDEPGEDDVSNRSVDSTDDELPEAEDVAKPAEAVEADPEPVKVEQEADAESEEEAAAVVEEVAEDKPVAVEAAAEPADSDDAEDAPEPITNGHAEESENSDDSPAPSPRATRSKKKTRKDT